MTSETSDTPQSTNDGSPPVHSGGKPARKKKRTLGSFPCMHCNKVFSRSDHLARHNLNHEPKEVFRCDFVIEEFGGSKQICGKTFVRKDLRERHARRHLELMGEDQKASNGTPESFASGLGGRKRKLSEGMYSSTSPESPSNANGHLLQISNLIHGNSEESSKNEGGDHNDVGDESGDHNNGGSNNGNGSTKIHPAGIRQMSIPHEHLHQHHQHSIPNEIQMTEQQQHQIHNQISLQQQQQQQIDPGIPPQIQHLQPQVDSLNVNQVITPNTNQMNPMSQMDQHAINQQVINRQSIDQSLEQIPSSIQMAPSVDPNDNITNPGQSNFVNVPPGFQQPYNNYQNNQIQGPNNLYGNDQLASQNLSDLYSQAAMNFSKQMPQTQNDILSWLFTDSSPTNMISSSPHDSAKQRTGSNAESVNQGQQGHIQNQFQQQSNQVPQQHSLQQGLQGANQQQQQQQQQQSQSIRHTSGLDFNPGSIVPSPYGGSSFSPLAEQMHGMTSSSIPMTGTNLHKQFNNSSDNINNAYYVPSNVNLFNNIYGLQDVNIFSNDDNPLDEVFLRNYQMQLAQSNNNNNNNNNINNNNNNGGNNTSQQAGNNMINPNNSIINNLNGRLRKDSSGATLATPAYLNFNMTSTASSTSPTNTNESNTSPKNTIDFSPSSRASPVESFEQKLAAHAEKQNTPKHKHIFIDSLVVDSILKALKSVDRETIQAIFHDDDTKTTPYRYSMEDRISYYISMYWLVFHTQFTILHKPSFDTKNAEPLLLASMIIVGCHYSSPTLSEALARAHKKSPEFKFSKAISDPLRYMIFQHEDFKTPVKLWVLQSLNMLEWVEKNFLSRRMHERGHVHHGTTVQLLRRSPLLGGNPAVSSKKASGSNSGTNTSAGEDDSDTTAKEIAASKSDTTDHDLFVRWVESESMKRITFMTFYLDIIDYLKFRHAPQVNFYQLQLLNLPCDDAQLWESNEVNGSFRKIVKRQKKLQQQQSEQKQDAKNDFKASDPKINEMKGVKKSGSTKDQIKIRNGESFLNVLKKLLKPYKPKELVIKSSLSIFTRKILLAGLASIMHQMQQTDLQNSSSLLTSNGIIQSNSQKSKVWKEILTKAFDNWHFEVIESYSSQVLSPSTSSIFNDISTSQVPFPMYHLSQIIGMSDINHYDIAIFGGSPANMSVDATMKDHYIVQRKLNNMWLKNTQTSKRSINELINLRSVIHCYLLLWQLMLKPIDDDKIDNATQTQFLDWNVNRDYFDTMYAVSIATLVLWCYAFSTCGLESQRFAGIEKEEEETLAVKQYEALVQLSAEGGYQYLSRVRQEFLTNLRKDNLHKEFNIHPMRLHRQDEMKPFSPHEVLTKYCELLSQISNKQNISGLCFLVGTKLMCSQWEVIRENAKLILNCGYRSIGKKNILCSDLFKNEFDD
ncbi:fungal-specific transcription factor domain-containing protein [Scheffersomyces xylosifermentans]|uniref:fungal-specific transcription factor domain-containing protein n=1 Tax=Scheffersomyces xylosifermentans TaxID=1304137 RepID=UPI00315C75BE